MRKLFVCLVLMAFCSSSFAQAVAASRMQTTVSGVVQGKMVERGFAANDPRFGATLSNAGAALGVAASIGVTVTAGAVTAPAWVTAGVALGMGLAVSLAFDGLVNWLFGEDGKVTTPTVANPNNVGGGYTVGVTYLIGVVRHTSLSAACQEYGRGLTGGSVGGQTFKYSTKMVNGNCNLISTFDHNGAQSDHGPVGYSQSTGCVGRDMSTPGANSICGPSNFPNVPGKEYPTATAAVAALTPEELAKPVSLALIADLSNEAWQKAAALPGYDGLPYDASNPISQADVAAYRTANPTTYPTVGDAVAPQPAPSGGTAAAPFTLPSGSAGANPGTTPAPVTPTNPSTEPLENLGPDPGIGAPMLEVAPTAQMILAPLLGLFPTVKQFAVPQHDSVCPAPSMSLFGSSLVLDAHCQLLDPLRNTLVAVMAVVWAFLALVIVLRA